MKRLAIKLLLFCMFAIPGSVFADDKTIVDAKGRIVIVSDTSRIVAVGGVVTEIIYALGEQDRIVARDSTSTYPAAALKKKNVGYMRALSSEGVLSVKPTLILAIEGSGPVEVVQVLKGASVPFVTVPHKFTQEGIIEKINFIGKVLGVPEKSKALVEKVNKDFADLKKVTLDIKSKKRVMFVMSMRGGRALASGEGTAASSLIKLAGATNAVTGVMGYKPLSDEAIIKYGPHAVLMMDRGGAHAIKDEELFKASSFKLTPAAKKGEVIRLDGLFMLGFGPRTAAAARELSYRLYGKDAAEVKE